MYKKYVLIMVVIVSVLSGCSTRKVNEVESLHSTGQMNYASAYGIDEKKTIQVDVSRSKEYGMWNPKIEKTIKDNDKVDLIVRTLRDNPPPPKEVYNEDGSIEVINVEPRLPDYDVRLVFEDNTSYVYKFWVYDEDSSVSYSRMEETGQLPGVISGERAEDIRKILSSNSVK